MSLIFNRRQITKAALALGAAGAFGLSTEQALANNDANEVIQKFTRGKKPVEGRVKLDLPEIAENGNTVPLTVTVESPMTAQNYISDILVVADGNPRPGIATFHLTPASGKATASTRIRLQSTENIIVVAKTSDGKFFTDRKQVKVTIGGCGG
jgi:sulfur-oxidizing protein SoxY